jgi:hypothetical protein
MSSKSKIVEKGGTNYAGFRDTDRRWRASRMESVVKNRGTKNIRKAKKA